MQQINLPDLFPDLLKTHPMLIPQHEFCCLPYFSRYSSILSDKQCKAKAEKSYKHFKCIKVKKGTVIYNCDDFSEKGYIVLNGVVQILKRKSTREKTQTFFNHVLHKEEEKLEFLYQQFGVPKAKAEVMLRLFYDDKIVFKFLPYHCLLNREQFGFGQLIRNSNRTHTAIALQQTQLLVIDKQAFDQSLRDFHYKKQNTLVRKLLSGFRGEIVQQLLPKMMSIMNTAYLLSFDNEELIYPESEFPTNLFYIVEGEIELRKKAVLTVPKKYMKHEIQDQIEKEVVVKMCRNEKGSFFGEEEIFSGRRCRNNSVTCILNNSLILKIDHTVFLKSISDCIGYQKVLIENSVYKKATADAAYQKQFKKAHSLFISQYEQYDNRKKEKMLSNFINNSENKNQQFQVFAPQGVFFRDTFQKLEGFQEAEKLPNRNQSIRRFKKKSTLPFNPNDPQNIETKDDNMVIQKILFSPRRSTNIAEFFTAEAKNSVIDLSIPSSPHQQKQQNQQIPSKVKIRSHRSIGKFNELKKDEEVYKRVLIKNGIYPKDRATVKENSVKPLVHHNFDRVVKQCVNRKNQGLKRVSKNKQNEIVLDSFQKSVQSLKFRSTTFQSQAKFMSPCKGADELRKKIQNMQSLDRLSLIGHDRKKSVISKIEDCLGVNQKPRSSQVSIREQITQRTTVIPLSLSSRKRSPEKIVMLNHMMKPITYYNSTEL